MNRLKGLVFLITLTFAVTIVFSGSEPTYVGVKKCKMCHKGKKKGEQFELWQKRGHAKAFETLKSEESKKIAKKMGIADPSTDQKCLECHVTNSAKKEEGVSCEACHGPGSIYKSSKIMSRSKYKKDRTKQHKLAMEAGLIEANKALCITCHNKKSPTYKEFIFEKAVKTIAHPIPRK